MRKLFILFLVLFAITVAQANNVKISSLAELNKYAQEDNQTIVLKSGIYNLSDYLNADSITAKITRKDYPYFTFRGNNNTFVLKGVKLIIDTRLREQLKFPIHTNEIIIKGNDNVFEGLEITETENGLSPGGAVLEIAGKGNTIKNFNILVKGSYPYGYGDLFGKGGPDVIRHKKQSGFLITGSYTKVYDVRLIMRAYGHGFFIQKDAGNIHFENCYVEGELRKTDDVLKENSGPAFGVNFRTWTANREGKYVVTPGYMKSLCEDGFRTYGQNKNISFKNCTAKNTRGGFELRTNGGVELDNCTTIGTERAYWVGNNAIIKKSKGDANYGPLIFVEGSNVDVELELLPYESDRIVHALATIQGRNNKVILFAKKERKQDLPVLVGYTHPEHGESMSPYGEAAAVNLQLINKTNMPIVVGREGADSRIQTKGKVIDNQGRSIVIQQL
ncbi:hypothetical protein Pedsa_3763 [Pseudopedobacter saltans DSM 12145]|uniref:Right handed beta helix domain-containing protein n=1 Tax=Pseudopedobacter saltans (strain ATCC 51119 / DSM 12145 / JCM 21818 / CCUG 39354 / LMG 10337 / NBRC 100064 / NCIMB 13643) TaxID=762903 RepID=F0S6G6_PSESL|nr:hypothetical protein [Pseudopedobacter saltans]ADY54292.1 hypothetical protein Pedsa_3763 [Pseudopedobacter saltans DSM 12145]